MKRYLLIIIGLVIAGLLSFVFHYFFTDSWRLLSAERIALADVPQFIPRYVPRPIPDPEPGVFGATPFRPAFFKTRLARSLAEGTDSTTVYVTSLQTADSVNITTNTIGDIITLVINPQSSSGREIISCTGTNTTDTTFTGCSRGYTFYDNTTNTTRMVAHSAGETVIISNEDLYQTTQYVNIDSPQTITGRKTFATSSGIRIGGGDTTYDKFIYASNGDVNLPYLSYDEDGNTTGCWAFSSDGLTSQCMTQASSTYTGGNGISIDAGGGIAVFRASSTPSGLQFDALGTGLQVSGSFYRDTYVSRLFASSTYVTGDVNATGTLALDSGSGTSTVNNLRPNTNNSANLGYYATAWRNLYVSGTRQPGYQSVVRSQVRVF